MANKIMKSQIIDFNPKTRQIPVRSFLHMSTENTNWKLIPIDIKNPIFLNLRIDIIVIFLSFYFMISKASFNISICHYFDRYNPIFKDIVPYFEISDKIFMICVYCMDFTIWLYKFLRKG